MKTKLIITEAQLKLLKETLIDEAKNPCWDGYEQVGMKEKGGKQVPNCVPKNNESVNEFGDNQIHNEINIRIGEIKNNVDKYQKFFENLTNKNYKFGENSDRDTYQHIAADLYSALLYINDLKGINN